jgi:hypothetical protein
MNVYEITEAKASSVLFYVAQSRRELAKESLREVIAFAYEEGRKSAAAPLREDTGIHRMTDEILKQVKEVAYLDGAQAACSWLEEVYGEGIRETDAWATYMNDEEAGE